MMNTKRLWKLLAAVGILLIVAIPATFAQGQKADVNSISFAGSGGYPPFNYLNESGDVIGFDVDVAQEIADRLGKTGAGDPDDSGLVLPREVVEGRFQIVPAAENGALLAEI